MLSIRQLSHRYPNGVQALDEVGLEIPRGMFGLLGPNGAGKSTLMRCLATLQQPTRGSIRFGSIDALADPLALRRVLGYLPQDFGVYPRGSALQLLDHLAVLKGVTDRRERRRAVESLLIRTNLHHVRNKRLASFSGGMRQRFGVAQALLGTPDLVIVDEPTAGLDPEERNRFHNLLAEIGEQTVVILSTHIVEDVADLCPRMAVLAGGRIVQQGTPADLRDQLADRIWTAPIEPGELAALQSRLRVLSSHRSAGRLVVRIDSAVAPGVGFEPAAPTLEDVYFSAIRSDAPGAMATAA